MLTPKSMVFSDPVLENTDFPCIGHKLDVGEDIL